MFPYVSIACHLFVVFVIQNVFLSSEYIQTISPSYILMVYCIVTYLTRRVKYRNNGGFAICLAFIAQHVFSYCSKVTVIQRKQLHQL